VLSRRHSENPENLDGVSQRPRLHELDSLRALAAIGVVGWHYSSHFGAAPLPSLMAPFYRHGEILVDFFFVLSGFVLARAYWNEQRSAMFANNVRDRIARMYPLHFATLCAVAVMQWILVDRLNSPPFVYLFNDTYDFVLNLLLLNRTGLERGFSFNGPSWSISTEFVVNVLFLAAIALPRNLVRAGMFALFAALLAVIVACGLISDATARGSAIDIFRTIVGFCCGVALHRVHAYWMPRINLNRRFADGLAVAAVSGFLCYSPQGEMAGLFHRLVVVICFPALIVGAIHGGAVRWILTLPPLVYLGTISYSIYLVHFPLQLGVHLASVAFLIQMPYDSALFLVGFFVATAGLASITYRLIEMPGKKLLQGRPVSILAKSLDQSLDLGNRK
jgi:peptidoglycan/LPS O-acetylase OafA/YrhL